MTLNTRGLEQATAAKLKHLIAGPRFDPVAWGEIIADDMHLRIGNAAPVIGRDSALAELGRFFARIDSLAAGFYDMWRRRETVYVELEVEFTDATGRKRRIPCAIVARAADGILLDLRFHLDPSLIP
ncbi:MAG TPA: nuclear transport factor 2 family protein [Burkholderiales bacterium]|jgi:hypothetical protein|nr:nuclear transport factor 2 family protein [Burkholderiales bacterium]